MAVASFTKQYNGATVVKFKTVELLYSINGVSVNVQPYYRDIHSDDLGGESGPPCDSQLLGGIARINVEAYKGHQVEMDRLIGFEFAVAAASSTSTPGTFPSIGTFVRQDGIGGELALVGSIITTTFPFAFCRGAIGFNSGTTARRYSASFEAWMDAAATRSLMTIASTP